MELPLLSRLPHSISTYWTGDECVLPGERDLMEYVDRIAAISPSVFEEKFRLFPSKVFRTSTGVAFDRYHRAVRCSSLPDEFRGLKRPIVGYAGIINSSRLDFALIEALVSKRRDWTFVFVGPEDEAARARMSRLASPNVRMLGPKPYEEAAGYMRAFDVAIIPYARTRFNLGCNPLKLYEYLAVGRSVVSTDLPSVRESGDVVRVACDAEEFERCIQAALEEQVTAETLERRYAVAREHSAERVAVALEPVLSGFSTSVGSVCR